jgi:predicted  nucleic acid-binding Zn-ribbon protein
MNPRLYTARELNDFKEKIRILVRKIEDNEREVARLESLVKNANIKKNSLERSNKDIEKQIRKFESIIAYAESLFDNLSIPYDRNRIFKR